MENWKQILKQLKLESIKRRSPGFFEASGGYTMKVKRYDDSTANGLASCIQDFVTGIGGYCNRINTTGIMRKINGEMKWTTGNTNKGAFDLRFIYQGKSGDVEIKIGQDKMSEAQLKEMKTILAAGGLVFVARDFPSFLNWWREVFPKTDEGSSRPATMETSNSKQEKLKTGISLTD